MNKSIKILVLRSNALNSSIYHAKSQCHKANQICRPHSLALNMKFTISFQFQTSTIIQHLDVNYDGHKQMKQKKKKKTAAEKKRKENRSAD